MTPVDALPTTHPDPGLELDAYVAAFEESAARGESRGLAAFLPARDHPLYGAILRELLRVDLEFAWSRGTRRRVEDYRERFPEIFNDPAALHDLACEEFRLRAAAGETPDVSDYRERLGVDLGASSGAAHHTHPTIAAIVAWPEGRIPQLGDTIPPGYHLVEELGRGAFGRVFLASETGLGGRPVVVKISSKLAGEPLTLARLQHTNIVPVYAAHRVGDSTALVMPFLGRTTLADLVDSLRAGATPHSGRGMVSTLVDRGRSTAGADRSSPVSTEPPAPAPGVSRATLDMLSRMTFVEAVLWIGSELADGLAHAHDRGVLHRDIKPANVLLTDDGRPMLLDFNLAVAKPGQLCGTPAYMAPEQLEAARTDRGIGTIQTDIYSLGLVLLELLAGRAPFEQPGGSWPEMLPAMIAGRKQPPLAGLPLPHDVTPGVRAILSKCLDPDPRARYESATQLREDLERQRTNLPLRFAREGSIRERMRKWSRRHPRLSSVATVSAAALVVIVGITTALLANQQHLRMMKAESARRELRDARESIQAAIPYGPSDPDLQWLEVLATAESALAPYQVADDGWVNSSLVTRLPEAEHATLRRDAAEVMFRAAEAAASLATLRPGDRERYLNHALEWNRRARRASPEHDTRDFLAQQARLLRSASRTEEADRVADAELRAPQPASDDLAVQARAELDVGRYPEAARKYREAVRSVEPRYSLWMGLAAAEMKLRHFESAIDALSAAAAIRPTSPWPHYHRGVARLELNNPAGAIADFDRFLELRPADPDGLLNRAAARYLMGDFRGAIADLDAAEQHGSTRTRLFALRETAKRRLGDQAGADRDRKTFLESNPTDALSWNVRGEWKRNSHPRDLAGAIADFDEALDRDPNLLAALRNKANLLGEEPATQPKAIELLDRVLALAPDSLGDRAGRAVLLARVGRKEEALREVAACAPGAKDGLALYQLASAALVAGDRARGLALLQAALRKDPGLVSLMRDDPDLHSVQKDTKYRNLIAAADTLNQ